MAGRWILKKLIMLTIALTLLFPSIFARAKERKETMKEMIRKPAVAGMFYPADPEELSSDIKKYLNHAKPEEISGDIIGIVSPHAGYIYSGWVAAYGYKLLIGKHFDNVVVISPSHIEYFGFSSVFPGKAYETPLGDIPVNQELAERIASLSDAVRLSERGHSFPASHRGEHALEVQLPFLQYTLKNFKLIPIVMGDQSRDNVFALGEALAEALKGESTLIVASSDLSHFYPDARARKLDRVFMDCLSDFDPDELITVLESKKAEACGGGPVAAAMIAAKKLGATKCVVLNYANSGDVTGDKSGVVGYTSAVFVREKGDAGGDNRSESASVESPTSGKADTDGNTSGDSFDVGLSREDKIFLLKLARNVIDAECHGRRYEIPPYDSPVLSEPRGAFVTLHKHGQLRGCIGYIEAVKPLVETIVDMAKAAAFNDWRFPPVNADEVPELEIEISILSPIREITDPSQIEVGRHGIIITRGMHRGLLLPQVATEWGWNREKFLEQTCLKAGLPIDAWKKKGTKIEIFSAEVFSEKELGL